MNETQLYINIMYWMFEHDMDENRDAKCYELFCDKVSDKKELATFIKNYAIL